MEPTVEVLWKDIIHKVSLLLYDTSTEQSVHIVDLALRQLGLREAVEDAMKAT